MHFYATHAIQYFLQKTTQLQKTTPFARKPPIYKAVKLIFKMDKVVMISHAFLCNSCNTVLPTKDHTVA